jgi:hypothetical protein
VTVLEAEMANQRATSTPPSSETTWTFSGVIQGQMLSDMLQLVSSNGLSGRFVVAHAGYRATLWFEQGRVCHAEAPDMVGDEAFFAAFGVETGRYFFEETSDLPANKTISSSTQFLILEALRKIDESRGGGG